MKTFLKTIIIVLVLSPVMHAQQDINKTSDIKGAYMGQKLPGTTPEVFAPGIVSTDAHEFSCCFSPGGNEFYFTRRQPELNQTVIMFTRQVNGTWTEPEVAPFTDNQFTFEPFITPDNKRLYYQQGKVVNGALQMFTLYVDRTEDGWGEVKDPGEVFNPMKTMHISSASNGNIYTTDITGGMGGESLGMIRKVNGEYQKLERLGLPLNNEKLSQHPWIAPDASYIVFTVRSTGH